MFGNLQLRNGWNFKDVKDRKQLKKKLVQGNQKGKRINAQELEKEKARCTLG